MNHRIESMKPSASMVLMARAKEMQKTDPTVIGLAGASRTLPHLTASLWQPSAV